MRMNQYGGYAFVILGACLWGMVGLFVQRMQAYGLYSVDIAAIRLIVSGIIMVLFLAPFRPGYLRVEKKDLIYFFSLGVITIGFFNLCYFTVMERANLSVAAIFVYTSPIFAMVFAWLFLKERITFPKIVAIILTVAGCGFVAGFFPSGGIGLSFLTIVLGLLSGIFASLFHIIDKYVSGSYHPVTITTYTMLCGGAVMIPISGVWNRSSVFLHWEVWGLLAGLVLMSTIFAYTLFTIGIIYIESSNAAILSTFELLISVSIGVMVFNDNLTNWQWIGGIMVVASIFITILFKNK